MTRAKGTMTRQAQLLMIAEDEDHLSNAIREVRPQVAFIDGSIWPDPQPRVVPTISAAQTNLVYLWDRGLIPSLPFMQRKDGTYEGPASGVVIQFIRSLLQEDILRSGRIAASTDGMAPERNPAAIQAFISDVWKVLSKVTSTGLQAIDPTSGAILRARVPEYRMGRAAEAWVIGGEGRFFRDRSTQNYFRPAT